MKTKFEQVKSKKLRYNLWGFTVFIITGAMLLSVLLVDTDVCKPWSNLIKLFPPLIALSGVFLLQQGRYYFLVARKFNNTVFTVHPKRQRVDNPSKRELITYKNRIIYRNKNEPSYEGEIVLDEINLRYGKGFHHNNIDDTDPVKSDQFGFSQFILEQDKIYLEHPYTVPPDEKSPLGKQFHQASVWLRE